VAQHPPQRAVHRHPDERDDRRLELRDLAFQNAPSLDVLRRLEHVDAGTGPGDEVGHADAPPRQPHVVPVCNWFGNDARFVEEAPEAVRRPGEVMPGQGRQHARVDADEDDADAGLDPVREAQMVVGWFILGHYELAV
jgi:hypothetical protein